MLLWSILIFLNQFILSLVPMVAWVILSIVGLPKIVKVMRREPLRELQETDFSAPLRVRELITWKGWFKLASRWGVRKTMCFYSLIMTAVSGATLLTLGISGMISIAWVIGLTIIVGIFSPIYFHRQVGKALK